jgi:hypothetical protein
VGRVKNRGRAPKARSRFRSEKQFQSWYDHCLKLNGWTWYHTLHSKGSQPGFLDSIAFKERPLKLLVAELKMPGNDFSPSQRAWFGLWKKLARKINSVWGYEIIIVRKYYPKDEDKMVEEAGGKRPLW